MERLPIDLRQALSRMHRSPAFAAVAVTTLALGIGANAAIFSLVDGILLEPLPYPRADRLVGLWHTAPAMGIPQFEQSDASFMNYREQSRSFESLALYRISSYNLVGEGDPERIDVAPVTPSIFEVLRVAPAEGRAFRPEEERPGGEPVVILSHALWTSRFGRDPAAIGQSLQLDGVEHEIVGVMPPDFEFPGETHRELRAAAVLAWVPFRLDPTSYAASSFSHRAIGRLRDGVTIEQARDELATILRTLPENYPGDITLTMMEQAQLGPLVTAYREDVVGDVGTVLWVLFGTVGLVLLIACANVANLFLVRAESRRKEIAVRSALGAGRARLAGFFLCESVLLGLLGGVLGLGLAMAALRLVVALAPGRLPRLGEVGIDGGVLAFTAALSLIAGLLFGAFPMLRYASPARAAALEEGGRGATGGRRRQRARNALVAGQLALALVLLVGSGLMLRSFRGLLEVDPGFDPPGVLTAVLSPPSNAYPDNRSVARLYQQLLDRLAGLPGVESVGAASDLPLSGETDMNGTWIEDHPVPPGSPPRIHPTRVATPGYFETLRIRLLAGRTFERADHEQASGAAIVSEPFARHYWPNESPLGKRLRSYGGGSVGEWSTVVGVVGGVRAHGLDQEPVELVYYPMVGIDPDYQILRHTMTLVVRSSGDPLALVDAVRAQVRQIDPGLPIAAVQTLDAVVSTSIARTTFTLAVLGIAAAVALLLGVVGIYGVVSYVVSQRRREIGIRMALGARSSDVGRMVLGQGLAVVAAGIGVGLAGALALTRFLVAFLFEVSALDPATFLAVPAVLAMIALLATLLPALRAAGVDPAITLRAD